MSEDITDKLEDHIQESILQFCDVTPITAGVFISVLSGMLVKSTLSVAPSKSEARKGLVSHIDKILDQIPDEVQQ